MEALPSSIGALSVSLYVLTAACVSILIHILSQYISFSSTHKPPVVRHWVPFVGSAISYGLDPYKFFQQCSEKYGNVFTFILFGRKITVCLGVEGNEFILNGKLKDVNAEEIYGSITTPVFGSDVVYDCPNSKLIEQKKFIKFGLTTEAFNSYVPLIEEETRAYIRTSPHFNNASGVANIYPIMSEITLYTAARTLQGDEIRGKLNSSFAQLYHDLDHGFAPINFFLPWAPLPHNLKRDRAQRKMRDVYMELIKERRSRSQRGNENKDMLWHLMDCEYKSGQRLPDKEIAHIMITLLMAGQHQSASICAWILLRLASEPDIVEELFQEQVKVLGTDLPPLTFESMNKLQLNQNVIKETLRLHTSIHSIMRKAKNPLPVPGTDYIVPQDNIVLASPGFTMRSEEHFRNTSDWDPHRWDDGKAIATAEEGDMVDFGYGAVSRGTKSPYLPFGAGRHRCIGEQFAYINIGVVVATFVREMKVRNVDGVKGVVGTDFTTMFSRPLEPATIHWEKR